MTRACRSGTHQVRRQLAVAAGVDNHRSAAPAALLSHAHELIRQATHRARDADAPGLCPCIADVDEQPRERLFQSSRSQGKPDRPRILLQSTVALPFMTSSTVPIGSGLNVRRYL